ncbi:MAG TPA: sigma-70 family RNA polymerase sigma factor, partial [Microvirga sp.]|nr:sigma-70 family RNA polymerase sigma factor [Microvirga sp.]
MSAPIRPELSDARSRLSDALARAGRGSQSALAEIYEATSAKLFGICLRILGDRGEAEDALQDIYLNVWRRAGSFDAERASPITWLATLARNRSIDRLRANGGRRGS